MANRCLRSAPVSLPESNLESINVVAPFGVCGWNPSVWPFKWKLQSSTFMWCCLFLTILQNKIQGFFPSCSFILSTWDWKCSCLVYFSNPVWCLWQAYDKDDPFPLWGTCLGFELLNIVTSGLGKEEFLASCDAENYSIPLEFTHGNTIINE